MLVVALCGGAHKPKEEFKMRQREETKFSFPLVIGVLLVVAFWAVPSIAGADGGDPFLVHACVNPSGLTRMVGPNDVCRSNE